MGNVRRCVYLVTLVTTLLYGSETWAVKAAFGGVWESSDFSNGEIIPHMQTLLESQNILQIDQKLLLVSLKLGKRLKGLVSITAIDLKWRYSNLAGIKVNL